MFASDGVFICEDVWFRFGHVTLYIKWQPIITMNAAVTWALAAWECSDEQDTNMAGPATEFRVPTGEN